MTQVVQEVVALIDRSGSMAGKEADSVGGFNSTLDVLRAEIDDNTTIKVSIKLFDHEEKLLIRSLDLSKVKNLRIDQFNPRGQTALYDAMGNTLQYFVEQKLKNTNSYDSCIIYVVTDGYENASKKYTADVLKDIIKNAEEHHNIRVIYLGANQDAILEASKFGINANQAMNYSESTDETNAAYRAAASVAGRFRSCGTAGFLEVERMASQTQAVNDQHSLNPHGSFSMGSAPPQVTRQNSVHIKPTKYARNIK